MAAVEDKEAGLVLRGLRLLARELQEVVLSYLLSSSDLIEMDVWSTEAWLGMTNVPRNDAQKVMEHVSQRGFLALFHQWITLFPDMMYFMTGKRGIQEILDLRQYKRRELCCVFDGACSTGNIDMIQRLRLRDGLSMSDINGLKWACACGQIAVLGELRMNWGFVHADALDRKASALNDALLCSDPVSVLNEFRLNWRLTKHHLINVGSEIASLAVFRGRLDVLVDLRTGWEFDLEDFKGQEETMVHLAVKDGRVDILQELRVGYGMPRGFMDFRIVKRGFKSGNKPLIAELRSWGF